MTQHKVTYTVIPQDTFICNACGYAMEPDAFKKGVTEIYWRCRTMCCVNRGHMLRMHLQTHEGYSDRYDESLCQCERCTGVRAPSAGGL